MKLDPGSTGVLLVAVGLGIAAVAVAAGGMAIGQEAGPAVRGATSPATAGTPPTFGPEVASAPASASERTSRTSSPELSRAQKRSEGDLSDRSVPDPLAGASAAATEARPVPTPSAGERTDHSEAVAAEVETEVAYNRRPVHPRPSLPPGIVTWTPGARPAPGGSRGGAGQAG